MPCRVSAEKSVHGFMGTALCVTAWFPYFLFVFDVCHFNYTVSLYWPLWAPPVWTLSFLDLDVCFLSQVREVFTLASSHVCSAPVSLSLFSFWDTCFVNVCATWYHFRSCWKRPHFLNFFVCSSEAVSTALSLRPPTHFSVSSDRLLTPPRVFLFHLFSVGFFSSVWFLSLF